eukprot:c12318_g1_i1.p1 GENE.c12318_g1_i1~~c12318_g1_i1.p1  ORF type:complete len:159 (-),score=45.70 c12318_g1_i1:73-549(-)
MVVKTELCNFSGYRIYPGHGRRLIRVDSKPFWFRDGRCRKAFKLKRNPRKLPWTQLYRRLHKKGTLEEIQKKKGRKAAKVQRPIVGADLAFIKAKKAQKPDIRQAAKEAALKELKEKNRKKNEKAAPAKVGKLPKSKVPPPKNVKQNPKQKTQAGAKR